MARCLCWKELSGLGGFQTANGFSTYDSEIIVASLGQEK